jgi:hypothetical protein
MAAEVELERRQTVPNAQRAARKVPGSVRVWLGLVGYLLLAKLLSSTIVPITFRSPGQQQLFDWRTIAVYSLLGLAGVLLAQRTGFADALDRRVSPRQRLLIPALVGFGLGAAAVVIDVLTAATPALARVVGQPSFNIDFPGSLLAYSAGGILVDVEYRLFTVPLLLWLISTVLLRGRGQQRTFWVLAAISTLFEPVLQGVGLAIKGNGAITPLMLGGYMLTAIPINAAQIVFYRRYGLLASVLVRQCDYLVWHILYGNFLYQSIYP